MPGKPKPRGRSRKSPAQKAITHAGPPADSPIAGVSAEGPLLIIEETLEALEQSGVQHVNTEEISIRTGLGLSQIRKELSGFKGCRAGARGYSLKKLRYALLKKSGSKNRIPVATVNRLSTYQRALNLAEAEGMSVISSADLAQRCGLKAPQIRKDLAYFGEFGIRGKGYYIEELKNNLRKILGVTNIWNVVLVGAGALGTALLAYKGFRAHGFTIEAVFDKFPAKAGPLAPGSPPVLPMSRLPEIVQEKGIRIGIVAVPSSSTQSVVSRLVEAGVTGILNFAPVHVQAPPHVKVKNVDLGSELEHLSFYLSKTTAGS